MTKKILFQSGETKLMIPGPVGQLETVVQSPESARTDVVAIICHPHSLHEGTMDNKVVTTIARAFRDLSFCQVRFNFRSVGKSEGDFGNAIGETDDLLAIINWLKQQEPTVKIYLVGFSFGSYVAYRCAAETQLVHFTCIAPPVHHFNFQELTEPTCPWLIIQGDQDEVVPAEQVFQWAKTLNTKPTVLTFNDTSHFFHGKLIELREQFKTQLKETI